MKPLASNGLLTKWALGLLAAGILGLGGWGGKTLIVHGERIVQSETRAVDMTERLILMDGKLDKLDMKLDRLREHERRVLP